MFSKSLLNINQPQSWPLSTEPPSMFSRFQGADRSQEQMFRADCINQAFMVGKNSTKGDQLEDTRGIDTRPEENFALVFWVQALDL